MRDAGTLLLALVDAAVLAVTRPPLDPPDLEALRRELEQASSSSPDPDGGLLIDDEALLLAQVLHLAGRQRAFGDARRAELLLQLAGVLLPPVRAAAWHAIKVRCDARPTA